MNEIKVSESNCSAICGVGKKTITFVTSETVDCGNSHCKPDIHEVEVDCDTNITCAPEQKNPEWGEWSSCSDNCIKNVNEKPTQTRKGSCNGCRLAILQVKLLMPRTCTLHTYALSTLFKTEELFLINYPVLLTPDLGCIYHEYS